ncbi:FG-GAP-like repeat-containing protein [Streptomyces sp. 1331.2]|uniref:FG-GAP-like repeat-containing protein n=1 Tax=Streptomyces sp. 1331.2 TaxID=1938835 RepID=UPI000BDC3CC4|nr:FG-GAP-like repeat-containing protein [Streptomyces sp. 1331.2]SOB78975.1 Repeat domain-containing protein [Streptomyces sp. 1331.2]
MRGLSVARTVLAAGLVALSTVVALPGSAAAAGDVFAPQVVYPVGHSPRGVAVGDFTGSGRLGLAVPNGEADTVSVLLGNGDGTFAPQATFPTGPGPTAITVADLDGDGRADLVTTNQGTSGVSVLRGNGDGTFQAPRGFSTGTHPDAVAVGDFNGDGRPDLAVGVLGEQRVDLLLGNGDGTFQPPAGYPTGTDSNPASIVLSDFDGDGRLDLAVADDGISSVSVFLGNGDGTLGPRTDVRVGGVPYALAVGDFNGDGRPDLVATDDEDGVRVLLGNGDGTFQPNVFYPAGRLPGSVAVGDFTGSGRLDLVVANGANALALLRGNGDGTFQPPDFYPTGNGHFSSPDAVAVGRFTGSGRLDVAVSHGLDDTVSVLLNTHRALVTTTLAATPNPSAYGSPVALTDTVCPATAGPVPTGTVSFADGDRELGTAALAPGGGSGCAQAQLGWNRPRPGTHTVTARYSGDGSYLPGPLETLEHRVTCERTITGATGPVLATGPSTCLVGARTGVVQVAPGAALFAADSTIDGGLNAQDASGVELCGNTVDGGLRIAGTTGPVLVGAPEQGCTANRIGGPTVLTGNLGGTEIAGNTITGALHCVGNTPPPTTAGTPNTVTGPRTRQCATL